MKSTKLHKIFQEALKLRNVKADYVEGLKILANPETELKLKGVEVNYQKLNAFKHNLTEVDLELYKKLEALVDSKVKKKLGGLFIYKIELTDSYINLDSVDPVYPEFVYEPEPSADEQLRVVFGTYTPPFNN